MTYDEFISSKARKVMDYGISVERVGDYLYDWQEHVTSWALKKGRAAFAGVPKSQWVIVTSLTGSTAGVGGGPL